MHTNKINNKKNIICTYTYLCSYWRMVNKGYYISSLYFTACNVSIIDICVYKHCLYLQIQFWVFNIHFKFPLSACGKQDKVLLTSLLSFSYRHRQDQHVLVQYYATVLITLQSVNTPRCIYMYRINCICICSMYVI